MATGSLVSNEVVRPQTMFEKYEKEMINLIGEFNHSPNNGKSSRLSQTSTYSDVDYGPLAAPLNKLRQLLESSKQETALLIKSAT